VDKCDIVHAAGHLPTDIASEHLQKYNKSAIFTYTASYKLKHLLNAILFGILFNGRAYTDVLLFPCGEATIK
jgi:hypothetical protein